MSEKKKTNNKIIKLDKHIASKQQKLPKPIQIIMMIAVAIFAIAIAFSIMFTISCVFGNTKGSDSPENVAKTVLKALDDNDTNQIKKLMHERQGEYETMYNALCSYANANSSNITIDINNKNNTFQLSDWNFEEAKKQINVENVSDAKIITAKINEKRKLNDINYQIVASYTIRVYNRDSKWFLYSLFDTHDMIIDTDYKAPSDTSERIGNDIVGQMSQLNGWTITNNTDTKIRIISKTGQLDMIAINTTDKLDDVIEKTKSNLPKKEIIITDSNLNGIECKRLFLYDNDEKTSYYMWFFKQPLRDSYVHYVSLSTTDNYSDYNAIKHYTF